MGQRNCAFCKIGKTGLLRQIPPNYGEEQVPCNRGIYEDEYCIATLAPEQYTKGHTLLILKNHRAGITDDDISKEELTGFIYATHKLVRHLQRKLRDNNGDNPERVYVCFLCEKTEHLHVHLIPRYRFTDEDIEYYVDFFKTRNIEFTEKDKDFLKKFIKSFETEGKEVGRNEKENTKLIESRKMGGCWYVAIGERDYKKSEFWNMLSERRAEEFEKLAKELRLSL